MIEYKCCGTELNLNQDYEFIERSILLALKDQNVSFSQAITIFDSILRKIESENKINL